MRQNHKREKQKQKRKEEVEVKVEVEVEVEVEEVSLTSFCLNNTHSNLNSSEEPLTVKAIKIETKKSIPYGYENYCVDVEGLQQSE